VTQYREATPDELAGWDELTVRPAGGHVLQSRAWGEHRATRGWDPRFLVGDDGSGVLTLTRQWPIVGGASAYIPRGPAPTGGIEDAVARLDGATRWLAAQGIDVVASDAEVPASGYAERIRAIGFRPIEEIQPSRHRLSVRLGPGSTEEAAFDNVAKSTRQRIRQAERDGLAIIRHDLAATDGTLPAAGYEDVEAPTEPFETAIGRFHDLALQTADRRHFALGSRASFLDWTTRAHAAGHLILLLAADDGGESAPVAGLMLYRHGGRLSTALSGDRPDARNKHPGAFHLLRWRAIQLAIREDAVEMDLGGVDVAGARHEPKAGEAMHGLYQHKRSFGAEWVELPGAHERVIRPARYFAGRVAARLIRR
jgi:lipid II:glycine glycyltransferase (peptidoglycan interpeptide bridge formation enzyme)